MANAVQAVFGIDSTQYNQKIAEMDAVSQSFAKKQKSYADQQHAQFERELQDLDLKLKKQRQVNEEIEQELIKKRSTPSDIARYATTFGGGSMDARAQNAADHEAWLKKLAAAKGITVEALKLKQAVSEGTKKSILGTLIEAHESIPGLNMVLRETLVIFREIGRGNWARVPGSFSMVIQGLITMRDRLGAFGALFTLTSATIIGSVAAIVGSFMFWRHRVNDLAEALQGLKAPDMTPLDISKLSEYESGWNRIRDAIRSASDEINNANTRFEFLKKNLDQSQSTEKKLLEIEKEKALIKARHNPASESEIREAYAKKEHDLEKKQQDEQLAIQAKHIADLQKEQDEKIAQAKEIKVSTEDREKDTQDILDNWAKVGTEKKKNEKGEEQKSELEKDQETVEKLKRAKEINTGDNGEFTSAGLSEEYQARLDAAQDRIDRHNLAVKNKAEYDKTKVERDELRKRQKELFDEAAKAGEDKVKAAAKYNEAVAMNPKILADNDELRKKQEELKNAEQNASKSGQQKGYALNAEQRIGAYAATPPDMKMLIDLNRQIAENTKKPASAGSAPAPKGPRYSSSGGVTTIDYTRY